jgi:hypothetical protein
MNVPLIQESTTFPPDVLPPEAAYETRNALLKAINAWAAPRGYAFTTGRSTKEVSGRRTITYACDRCSSPPDPLKVRQRRTTTRGTNCQFSVLAKESPDHSTWVLKHRPDQRFAVHNHEPSRDRSAHPAHRILSTEDSSQVARLSNAGVASKDIRTYMRQNSGSIATQQDIYNRIADARRKASEGQSTIQALANQLDREGFWSRIQFDAEGRVTAVIFAHPDSLAYLQTYPDVLLLDCTYKTNKYGMPLLDMIGVDACQRSFCIAFAFLSGEAEDDYLWALNRLKSLYEVCNTRLPSVVLTDRCIACMNAVASCFPSSASLICLWHANKAVLRHCQKSLTDSDGGLEAWNEFYESWHSMMRSPDEQTFSDRFAEFHGRFASAHLDEVYYVTATWLDPYKERLVKAWVDRYLHFGNVVTSRAEGIHGLLKEHLKRSTLDLFEAWKAVKHALLNQLTELKSNQAKQQIRTPIELSGPLYSAVRGWVSHEGLRKIEEQRKLLLRHDPPFSPTCTGTLTRTLGLPCAHFLKDLQESGQPLQLSHIHSHWRLDRKDPHQLLLEPRQRVERINPTSKIPLSSTRREPSGFEMVETANQRAPPKCSRCHAIGHRMSSKACPLRRDELLSLTIPGIIHDNFTLDSGSAIDNPLGPRPAFTPEPASLPGANSVVTTSDHEVASASPLPCLEISTIEAVRPGSMPNQTPSPARTLSLPTSPIRSPTPPYDDPLAIYQRYVAARESWYSSLPRGAIKTNQEYRKAMALPARYPEAKYKWCLDYKQMTKQCSTSSGIRDWTKEEMMAYLDWSKSEDDRIDGLVYREVRDNPFGTGRRGVDSIWKGVERDIEEQESLYSSRQSQTRGIEQTECCIIVKE